MNLMDLVSKRIGILYEGVWRENQVKIMEDTRYLPQITEQMLEVAKERFAARKTKNPKVFDGNAFHLDLAHSTIQPNRMILAIGRIKYSIYDIARKEYTKKYGWKELPTGMATNAVVLTSDSKIIMHKRFPQVDHTAKINTIGGIYGGEPPFEDVRKELHEELKLKRGEIKKLLLLGIYTRLDERVNHGLAFLTEISLTAKEVLEKEKILLENRKEGEIFFFEKNSKTLHDSLRMNHQKILSDGFAGLVMVGHYLWGKNWSKIPNKVE